MKTKIFLKKSMLLIFCHSFTTSAISAPQNRDYEIPPISSTSADVPYISDEETERCVEIYNKANWLEEEIQEIQVDSYSQESVDAYNSKIKELSKKSNYFNKYCAGKQSESAYRATQKLNQENNN